MMILRGISEKVNNFQKRRVEEKEMGRLGYHVYEIFYSLLESYNRTKTLNCEDKETLVRALEPLLSKCNKSMQQSIYASPLDVYPSNKKFSFDRKDGEWIGLSYVLHDVTITPNGFSKLHCDFIIEKTDKYGQILGTREDLIYIYLDENDKIDSFDFVRKHDEVSNCYCDPDWCCHHTYRSEGGAIMLKSSGEKQTRCFLKGTMLNQ